MGEQPAQVMQGHAAQLQGRRRIVEGVRTVGKEGLVDVHARTVDAEHRLGHEGGVQPMQLGNRTHHVFEGHYVVGRGQGVVVAEVNLVLPRGNFVVGGLHVKPHLLQGQDYVPAGVLAAVQGAQVEVAALIMGGDGGAD